jgi:hypothetical protein
VKWPINSAQQNQKEAGNNTRILKCPIGRTHAKHRRQHHLPPEAKDFTNQGRDRDDASNIGDRLLLGGGGDRHGRFGGEDGKLYLTIRSGLCLAGIPIEADHVIDAEVFAILDFDHDEGDDAGIGDFVGSGGGDVGGLFLLEHDFVVAAVDFGGTGDDNPMFAAVVVHLPADFAARLDFDSVNPVVGGFFEQGEGAPTANLGDVGDGLLAFGGFGGGFGHDKSGLSVDRPIIVDRAAIRFGQKICGIDRESAVQKRIYDLIYEYCPMEPITLATIVATLIATKATEKVGEKIGEGAFNRLLETFHRKAPDTVKRLAAVADPNVIDAEIIDEVWRATAEPEVKAAVDAVAAEMGAV